MITIKIGGSVVDDLHESAVEDIRGAAQGGGVVLVHGGGKEVTRVSAQMGLEPRFVMSPGGIKSRYTDAATAGVFTMVMSGRIGKNIVRMLQKNGIDAVGLSGVDAGVMRADRKKRLVIQNDRGRRQAIDGGYTGKITGVNSGFIRSLVDQGMVPVISPVAMSEEYDFLNVDGDRAAAYVAGSTGCEGVVFITNVDGLMMDGRLVADLPLEEARRIRPTIGPGMEKKVLAATEALDMGVTTAMIANGQKENPISKAMAHDSCTVIRK